MKSGFWVILGVLVLLAAAALLDVGHTDDADFGGAIEAVAASPSPPPPLPDVRVRQEFITVPVPPADARVAPVPARSRPATAALRTASRSDPASGGRKIDTAPDRRNLLERAGRLVLGDGRHRPEPFPRIKNDEGH